MLEDHELISTAYNAARNQKSIPTANINTRDQSTVRNAAGDHALIPTAYNAARN